MKKGFTLIELLAVIVILAIISLIAIPKMAKLVDNIKYKADLQSINGYVDAANNYYLKAQMNESLYDTLGSNIIDKLSIKGEKLNGSIVVTNDGKVELAIVKNDKCYRKSALSSDIEILERNACNVNSKAYVSNNGQLHVCGRNLCNRNNNVVRLIGASASGMTSEINKKSLHTLKNWGANVVRIFVTANVSFTQSYIGNEENYLKTIKQMIDDAIYNDLYVIVNWDPARNNGNPFTDKAVEMFMNIATTYKNDPHVIYEIWNEPTSTNSWNDVKNHASKTIPAIRNISPNAIVLVGTPNFDSSIENAINDPLNYKNIMYTHHAYASDITDYTVEKLKLAYNNETPVFESEWGSINMKKGVFDMVMKPHSKAYIKILNKYGIGYTTFGFGTSTDQYDNIFGIVKRGNWKDDLPDSILKPNGLFYKNILSGGTGSFKANLMKGFLDKNDRSNYRSDEWINKIVSIKFKTSLNVPSNAVVSWDLSLAQDKSIIGYLTSTTEADKYDMTIVADGKINAPINANYLFGNMTNLKSIDFTNFETYGTKSINQMFVHDENLESLDLSGFDASAIDNMWNTFNGCNNLKNINFKNWNPKITSWGSTFLECQSLEELDLIGFNVDDVDEFGTMFFNNKSLKKLNISTWNPKTTKNMYGFLFNASSLEEINMSSFEISDDTDLTRTLTQVKKGAKIIVKNQSVIDKLKPTATNELNFIIK